MNMMSKCAKFLKGSPSGKKKLSSISRAPLIFSERGRFCVQLCVETLCKRATSVAIWPTFPWNFFYAIFTRDDSLLFYTMLQKSKKWAKTEIKGSCLNPIPTRGGAHCAPPPPSPPKHTSSNISRTPWATGLKLSDNLNELIFKTTRATGRG